MKIKISLIHNYLSGWKTYKMIWKTDFQGVRNKTIQSVVVASKEPFTAKSLKAMASGIGVDTDLLFTEIENCNADCKTMNSLGKVFNEKYGKNLAELNKEGHCEVRYTATLNPAYKPLETSFETILAYKVNVLVEFKSGVIQMVFPSQGRKKNDYFPFFVSSEGEMKNVCEEEEAIFKVKSRIGKYLADCDTDEKFAALPKKLEMVHKEMMKHFK